MKNELKKITLEDMCGHCIIPYDALYNDIKVRKLFERFKNEEYDGILIFKTVENICKYRVITYEDVDNDIKIKKIFEDYYDESFGGISSHKPVKLLRNEKSNSTAQIR